MHPILIAGTTVCTAVQALIEYNIYFFPKSALDGEDIEKIKDGLDGYSVRQKIFFAIAQVGIATATYAAVGLVTYKMFPLFMQFLSGPRLELRTQSIQGRVEVIRTLSHWAESFPKTGAEKMYLLGVQFISGFLSYNRLAEKTRPLLHLLTKKG